MRAGFPLILLCWLLSACSGPGNEYAGELVSDSNPQNNTPDKTPTDGNGAAACAAELERFNAELWAPVLAPSCMQCHQSGGIAAESGLVLKPASVSSYLADNLKPQIVRE